MARECDSGIAMSRWVLTLSVLAGLIAFLVAMVVTYRRELLALAILLGIGWLVLTLIRAVLALFRGGPLAALLMVLLLGCWWGDGE